MTALQPTHAIQRTGFRPVISLPQPVWLILLALALGLSHGLAAPALIKAFGAGFGRALGDFALILIPSFVLAACLARQPLDGAPRAASLVAPVTAAGMVCPDTAYAALASIAKNRKLSVAFGSHAGYRLLFPAGPLIVATGLGLDSSGLWMTGLALMIPVWLTGELWARFRNPSPGDHAAYSEQASVERSSELFRALLPLVVLGILLVLGGTLKPVDIPLLDFITRPKGALLVAAALAVWATTPERRRESLDAAMSRSASLLLVVGAASAFGLMLTTVLPIADWVPSGGSGMVMLVTLFAVAAAFKVAYGSSTVTLATVTPVLAPVIHAAGLSPADRIMLPLSRPALMTVAVFTFMWNWNDFFGPLIYLSSKEKYTLALGLQTFIGQYTTQWHYLMAASLVVVLPMILLFFFAQRAFIEGIAFSGLKG